MIRRRRNALGGLIVLLVTLTGCTLIPQQKGIQMDREAAKEELLLHADAVTSLLDGDLPDEYIPDMFTCPMGEDDGKQWTLRRVGNITDTVDGSTQRVFDYFSKQGFTVRLREVSDVAREVLATSPSGLDMSVGVGHNGYTVVMGQTRCFPER